MDADSLPKEVSFGPTGISADLSNYHIIPDTDRVIIHLDVDCFYAQVTLCMLGKNK